VISGWSPGGESACAAEQTLQAAPMCACWAHWMVLLEDLRSELLTSFGRGRADELSSPFTQGR
jgi:hypothetical protein